MKCFAVWLDTPDDLITTVCVKKALRFVDGNGTEEIMGVSTGKRIVQL